LVVVAPIGLLYFLSLVRHPAHRRGDPSALGKLNPVVAENGLGNLGAAGAERQAHSQFVRPPLDRVRDDGVHAARGEQYFEHSNQPDEYRLTRTA
jgi:hypothetical protein